MSLKLSVCFFTYNRSGYLAHAVSEFIKNCHLDRKEYEIIVSDDGSDEIHKKKIIQIKEKFGIEKVFLNKHKGIGHNFNSGLRVAEGRYVLHLEDDWQLQPECGNFLNRSMAFLDQHPEVSIIRLTSLNTIDPLNSLNPYEDGFQKIENGLETYSNSPHLKRRDFHKYLGWYDGNLEFEECQASFQQEIVKLKVKVCWAGSIFEHFGSISCDGFKRENINDTQEVLYDSSSSRDELLDLAKVAMKDNKVFLARHALETFLATGSSDPQIEQSFEIVSEMCRHTECVG